MRRATVNRHSDLALCPLHERIQVAERERYPAEIAAIARGVAR